MHDSKNVLEKVRHSLGRLKPLEKPPEPPVLDEPLVRLVLSDIGLPALFQKKAIENKIGLTPVRVEQLHEELVAFLRKSGVKSVMLPRSKFLDRLEIANAVNEAGIVAKYWDEITLDESYDFDCGLTDVYRVIAETGSLVVRASPQHGRALSLVPALHVAIVEPKNCVGDLIDLLELIHRENTSSGTFIITGPSKTSDIEMNLVVGVHGPVKVHVFLLK